MQNFRIYIFIVIFTLTILYLNNTSVMAAANSSSAIGSTRNYNPEISSLETPAAMKRFPAEWEEHERTFMIWPASSKIWLDKIEAVRRDIASIAKAIAKFEPVVVLAQPNQLEDAKKKLGSVSNIEFIPIPVDDLWARDTLPVFIENAGQLSGVDFNFNGWGKKQNHQKDKLIASNITKIYGINYLNAPLVSEGGALETDGAGTLLVTESSIVNKNRNPRRSRDEIERELKNILGIQKVIWFNGVRGEDITDDHVDTKLRFTSPGVVVLNRAAEGVKPDVWSISSDNAKEVLKNSTDARGKPFTIIELPEPNLDKITGRGHDFVSSYINYYVTNGGVIIPRFNDDEADEKAKAIIQKLFPTREIVQVEIDTLAWGGGGIHCSTHDQPKIGMQ